MRRVFCHRERLCRAVAAVLVCGLLAACNGQGLRASSRNVTLEVLPVPAGTATVGDTLVLPVGDPNNPLAVASASNDEGVASLRVTGRMLYTCHEAGGKSVARTAVIDESSPNTTATTSPISSTSPQSRLVTVDLSGRALSGRCAPNLGAGGFTVELQAEATFADPNHTVGRSPPLRVRYKTVSVVQLNIIGVDATATAAGMPPFAERLDALTTALAGFDVVALQEVGTGAEVTQLAARAGYPFTAIATGSSTYPDLAFLSRLPLTDVQTYAGPKPGCVLGINCGGPIWIHGATLSVDGRPLRIVNAHVSPNSDTGGDRSDWRAAQARFIKDKLVDPFPGRVVVAGDFNGNYDLAQPAGPLLDSGAVALDKTVSRPIPTPPDPKWATHCGDRIELILASTTMFPLTYNGVYGGSFCPPEKLSDHPRVSSILSL
jgi:endonuclease/exonuclease/phosphatase family metal-dependent hydrolase